MTKKVKLKDLQFVHHFVCDLEPESSVHRSLVIHIPTDLKFIFDEPYSLADVENKFNEALEEKYNAN